MTFDETDRLIERGVCSMNLVGIRALWAVARAERDRLKKSNAELLAALKGFLLAFGSFEKRPLQDFPGSTYWSPAGMMIETEIAEQASIAKTNAERMKG